MATRRLAPVSPFIRQRPKRLNCHRAMKDGSFDTDALALSLFFSIFQPDFVSICKFISGNDILGRPGAEAAQPSRPILSKIGPDEDLVNHRGPGLRLSAITFLFFQILTFGCKQ